MDKILTKATDYDNILLGIIPNLDEYQHSIGGEGYVYFIDDNFVIKEYTWVSNEDIFEQVFDKYCQECKMFEEMGLNVPKIYSWLKLPDVDRINGNKNRYFILEERLHGREICAGNLRNYDLYCKDICSYEEFTKAYINRKDPALLEKIVQAYYEDYLFIDARLESMSDKQLEDFIMTIFKMYVEGIYTSPDVFFRNLILDDDINIKLIDNIFRYTIDNFDSKSPIERLFSDIVKILNNINLININLANKNKNQVLSIIEKDRKVRKQLLDRMIKLINQRIDKPIVKNREVYRELQDIILSMFGKEAGEKSLSLIQLEK